MGDHPGNQKRKQREQADSSRRKMLQVACLSCRRRKTRCDGGRPACAKCGTKGETCEYETHHGESRMMAIRRENGALHDRVAQLEAKQAESPALSSPSGYSGTPSDHTPTLESPRASVDGSMSVGSSGLPCSRALDLLHTMATTSDLEASMLLAKLRTGYSVEELADEAERALVNGQNQPPAPFRLLWPAVGQTLGTSDGTLDDIVHPALQQRGGL